jgi:hypothetical protein
MTEDAEEQKDSVAPMCSGTRGDRPEVLEIMADEPLGTTLTTC